MTNYQEQLFIYLNLAIDRKKKLQISDHNRLLVLSSVAACELGLRPISEYCRQLVLKNNPGHMMGRYSTVNDALADSDFQYFLSQIRRRHTVEHAETELEKLRIDYQQDLVQEGSVENYLTRLFGVDYQWILEHFEQ